MAVNADLATARLQVVEGTVMKHPVTTVIACARSGLDEALAIG